jgi:hypothetical protein
MEGIRMTSLAQARNLLNAVEALGVQPPQSLTGILDLNDALWAALRTQAAADTGLVNAYRSGALTAATAPEMLQEIASRASIAEAAGNLVRGLDPVLSTEFAATLKGKGGNDLIHALRPVFDTARDGILHAGQWFNRDSTAEQALALNNLEASAAWHALPEHGRTLDRIYNIVHLSVRDFGLLNERAYDDMRQPIAAFILDGEHGANLDAAPQLLGGSPQDYGQGGRWQALLNANHRLRLNIPAEAHALVERYYTSREESDANTRERLIAEQFADHQKQAVIDRGFAVHR